MLAGTLLSAALLVAFFAFETAAARRERLLAEGRRVALSAVTLYDVLRLTGSVEDKATLTSFVQAAVRGTDAEDELVYVTIRDASGAVLISEGSAVPGAPGILEVRASVVARDQGAAETDAAAGSVVVGLSTEPGARELAASVGLGGGAALLAAVGLALSLSSVVRRRVLNPVADELEAEREEQARLAGALSRHVGRQRAGALAAGERARQGRVTVLVVNVQGFLPMLQRHTPQAALQLLDELYATTSRVVHAHHGHVEKMLGDTVQCVWGVAGARPDDELRAVAAGLELQDEIGALAAARKARGDEPFKVGIGIATGDAVIGAVGGAVRAESVVVGEVTALATAVEQEAKIHGFGLLVAEETFSQVATHYEGAATPPMVVRGMGMPLTFYRVRRRADRPDLERTETPAVLNPTARVATRTAEAKAERDVATVKVPRLGRTATPKPVSPTETTDKVVRRDRGDA